MPSDNKIVSSILAKLENPQLIDELVSKLSLSELNSLLMEVFSQETNKMSPIDVLKSYADNPFVKPSTIDPIRYHSLEAELLLKAKENNIVPIILSPIAILGSCASVASVSQNKIISALRGTEVLSDPTNMLAIYIADGIKNGTVNRSSDGIHVCTTHRLTRVQAKYYPSQVPHFGLFCMVSSGEDSGSYNFEKEAIKKHLSFYKSFSETKLESQLSFSLQKRAGYKDINGFFNRIVSDIRLLFPETDINIADKDMENIYYKGINIKFYTNRNGQSYEIGDAGFVDWTQNFLSRKKERMFISAFALDRLLM